MSILKTIKELSRISLPGIELICIAFGAYLFVIKNDALLRLTYQIMGICIINSLDIEDIKKTIKENKKENYD